MALTEVDLGYAPWDTMPRPAPARLIPTASPYFSANPKLNYIAAFTACRPGIDRTDYDEFHATLNATAPILWKMGTVIVREPSPPDRETDTPWNWKADRYGQLMESLREENGDYLSYIVGLVNGCEFVVLHDSYATGDLKFVRAIALAHHRKVFSLKEYTDLYYPDRMDPGSIEGPEQTPTPLAVYDVDGPGNIPS